MQSVKGRGTRTLSKESFMISRWTKAPIPHCRSQVIKRFKKLVRENRTKDLLNKENNFKIKGFQTLYNAEQYSNLDIPGDSDEPKPKKARTDHYGPSNANIETTAKLKQEAEAADPLHSAMGVA